MLCTVIRAPLCFISLGILTPVITSSPVVALETMGPALLFCANLNPAPITIGQQWFAVGGDDTVLSTEASLVFPRPIKREQAGEYRCVITLIDGTSASANGTLIVECKSIIM